MTGLLRTTLYFFLPVFVGLAAYHTWMENRPSAAQQKLAFAEENAEILSEVRETVDRHLQEGREGSHKMPEPHVNKGVLIAEVIDENGLIFRLVAESILDSGSWTLVPTAAPGSSYAAVHHFELQPAGGASPVPVIFHRETLYQSSGDLARLNIYLQTKSFQSDE